MSLGIVPVRSRSTRDVQVLTLLPSGTDNRLVSRRQPICGNAHWYWTDHAGNRLGAADTTSGSADGVTNRMTYTAGSQFYFSLTRTGAIGDGAIYNLNWHWYDANGLRVATEVQQSTLYSASNNVPGAGTRTYYVYDGNDVALAISRNAAGLFGVRQRFISEGIDGAIAVRSRLTGGGALKSLALIGDYQGSTLAAVRADGIQESSASYFSRNPFGFQQSVAGSGSTINTETGFTGASTPNQTGGFTYLRNRWYDGQTGRFLTQDPIGLAGGVNLYAYPGNNPVRLTSYRFSTVNTPPSLRPYTAGLYISSACAGGRMNTPGVVARAT